MIDLKQISIQIIKDNQASSGAYVASPNFSQYGYSWLRDGMWIAHSMDIVGEHASATAFHTWVARTMMRYDGHINRLLQKIADKVPLTETDYLPTRFTVDSELGSDDWTDFQLDGYGTWLWGLVQHVQHFNPDLWQDVSPAVELVTQYLEALWPSTNYDCWEEFRDEVHVSTLAAIYGGLNAVRSVDSEMVSADILCQIKDFTLKNGVTADGRFMKFLGNENVDANLLWMAVPFDLVDVTDARFLRTLEKIEKDILRPGGGVYRYKADTYFGGGEWLLLTCWLAWAYIKLERIEEARSLIGWTENQASSDGAMPEQVSQHVLDPSYYEPWVERWGKPASPLLWSHAMYLIVQSELEARSA